MSYKSLVLKAWEETVTRSEKGYIILSSEGDVRCHLFSCCLELLEEGDFSMPSAMHSEVTVSEKRADPVLGKNEVGVEIKHLRVDRASPTFRDAIKDASKVARQG